MTIRLSVHARIALGAVLIVLLALVATAYALMGVAALTVREALDEKMDIQISAVERALKPNGEFDRSRLFVLRDFEEPEADWGWQARTGRGVWRGGVGIRNISIHEPKIHEVRGAYSGEAWSPTGAWFHLRQRQTRTASGRLVVDVAVSRTLIQQLLRKTDRAIATRIAILAAVLSIASWLALRAGLSPLRTLRDQVVQVRSGEAGSVGTVQPAELTPLASELNELVERNFAGLNWARSHLGNLAHAIKTPLASLALQLEHEQASEDARALVQQINHSIGHHLRRARNAAVGRGNRVSSDLAEIAADQVLTMQRLFAARHLRIEARISRPCLVAVDAEDLSEMLGNILENGCRFARSLVYVDVLVDGRTVNVSVLDDGPGIAKDDIHIALRSGHRLDESSTGYGFGLVITKELAELYGGSLDLSTAETLGGLRVTISLPGRPRSAFLL